MKFRFNIITLVGLILVVTGALAFAFFGIQSGEVDPGTGVTAEAPAEGDALPLAPLLGGIALVSGVVLVVIGARGPPQRRR